MAVGLAAAKRSGATEVLHSCDSDRVKRVRHALSSSGSMRLCRHSSNAITVAASDAAHQPCILLNAADAQSRTGARWCCLDRIRTKNGQPPCAIWRPLFSLGLTLRSKRIRSLYPTGLRQCADGPCEPELRDAPARLTRVAARSASELVFEKKVSEGLASVDILLCFPFIS